MVSRDVLFYSLAALAVASIVLTIIIIWTVLTFRKIFTSVGDLIQDFRNRLNTIDEILHTIQDKISSTHIQLTALAGGLKELIGFFVSRRAKRRSSTRASDNGDDF